MSRGPYVILELEGGGLINWAIVLGPHALVLKGNTALFCRVMVLYLQYHWQSGLLLPHPCSIWPGHHSYSSCSSKSMRISHLGFHLHFPNGWPFVSLLSPGLAVWIWTLTAGSPPVGSRTVWWQFLSHRFRGYPRSVTSLCFDLTQHS